MWSYVAWTTGLLTLGSGFVFAAGYITREVSASNQLLDSSKASFGFALAVGYGLLAVGLGRLVSIVCQIGENLKLLPEHLVPRRGETLTGIQEIMIWVFLLSGMYFGVWLAGFIIKRGENYRHRTETRRLRP